MRHGLLTVVLAFAATSIVAPTSRARGEDVTCALLDPQLDRSAVTAASCLGCHDGSAARSVTATASHPVDVSYAAAWLEAPGQFHGIIPGELALSGGRVTCTTCHDGASPHPHRNALATARLCTACHAH